MDINFEICIIVNRAGLDTFCCIIATTRHRDKATTYTDLCNTLESLPFGVQDEFDKIFNSNVTCDNVLALIQCLIV